jgi:predicted alpha/beta-fold hydrolase
MQYFVYSIICFSFYWTKAGCHISYAFQEEASDIDARHTDKNSRLLKQCPSLFNFSPTPLYAIDYYGNMQTVCQTILRDTARVFSRITYRREPFLLSDGGTVGLDWVYTFKGKECKFSPDTPTVVIMHGLCGDSNAEYLVHLVEVLIMKNYRVVVMVARGCGGVPLSTPIPFNGARTLDFKETVDYVHTKYPDSILFGMGFSLGKC